MGKADDAARLTLDNSSRRFAPATAVRIRATHNGVTYDLGRFPVREWAVRPADELS